MINIYIIIYIYMSSHVHPDRLQILRLMLRVPAVQTGGAAGTSFALVWRLLQSFDQSSPVLPYELSCPDIGGSWHWPSIFVGVVLGLFLGPVLEALCALRTFVFQITARRASHLFALPKGYYKLC